MEVLTMDHLNAPDPDSEARIRASYRPCSVCGAADHAGAVHDTGLCDQCGHGRHHGLCPVQAAVGTAPDELCGCFQPTGSAEESMTWTDPPLVEAEQDFSDLRTYLCSGSERMSREAAKRLDQRAVDAGQLSPRAFREIWDELPRPTFLAHKIWCTRHNDHDFSECPVWGEESTMDQLPDGFVYRPCPLCGTVVGTWHEDHVIVPAHDGCWAAGQLSWTDALACVRILAGRPGLQQEAHP